MSTNSECEIIEIQPGEWFYILEDYSAPKNAWDWREYADAYGPFPTEDAAFEHLRDNHANPGGYGIQEYDSTHVSDEVERRLIEQARKRPRSRRPW